MSGQDQKEKQIEEVKEILSAAGIKMSVYACGCCESPMIQFEKDGVPILFESEGLGQKDCNFDMLEETEND